MHADPVRAPAERTASWAKWVAAAVGAVVGALANRHIGGPQLDGVGLASLYALPLLLGVLGALASPSRPYRGALVLSAISLLVATPLLGEGVICLIFIAPWHCLLSPLMGGLAAMFLRRYRTGSWSKAALVLLALGGAAGAPRLDARLADPDARETFADSVVVDATPEQVWRSIERLHMDFSTPAPLILAGLPRPLGIEGGGAEPGAERRVIFDNGVVLARVTAADPPRSFDLDLSVEQSGPEFFDHWAELMDSRFVFEPLPGGKTRISHVTTYRPLAFPRWYFGRAERLLGPVVQRYMLEAYAAELFPTDRAPVAALP